MKKFSKIILVTLFSAIFTTGIVHAQYMPMVYDKLYGESHVYTNASTFANGEIVITGESSNKAVVTWVDRDGTVMFSKTMTDGFKNINKIEQLNPKTIMLIGGGEVAQDKRGNVVSQMGRVVIMDNTGAVVQNFILGDKGTVLTCGKELKNGNLIFGGYRTDESGLRKGLLIKVNPRGKVMYSYTPSEGSECFDFEVMGSTIEFVVASFSGIGESLASVVRIDELGKPFFITPIPFKGFKVEKMLTSDNGSIFICGGGSELGGYLLKLRSEGDVVFTKQVVAASAGSTLDHLYIGRDGNLLVGGSGGGNGHYSLLRDDGTELSTNMLIGKIESMNINDQNGESVIAGFNSATNRGVVIKLSPAGRHLYENSVLGSYDLIKINPLGEVLMADAKSGRLTMMSNYGEIMFDRLIKEDKPQTFANVYFGVNGDVIFADATNRLVKLAHGIYVSDVVINKPVNGFTTALFTITLTGYASSENGAPLPVVVNYSTLEGTAKVDRNFDAVGGSLSFVPANDGTNRYMIKQSVEAPIKANDYVEGRKKFEMMLNNVSQSYIIKTTGECVIEDQQAVLKFLGSREGQENGEDLVMEVGLFKSNGTPLINDTGADIMISGVYSKGTADASNFDMGRTPRLVVKNKTGSGAFNIKTLENTRYETPRTVVVDFNNINALSDANISFETAQLSCMGHINDQPAMLAITSLGDHGRRNNNVSGFFKVSLLRSSDGALLTNATGSDIEINCEVDGASSGVVGEDFVLTNRHDLRIWGDGNRSAVNLEGVVLYSSQNVPRTVKVNVTGVKSPLGAPVITLSPLHNSASFNIK